MPHSLDSDFSRRDFLQIFLLAPAAIAFQNQSSTANLRYVNFDEAEPILRSRTLPLPQAFAGLEVDAIRSVWPRWVAARDKEIRDRLLRGEEDTLANFVLFGTSFTALPRMTEPMTDAEEVDRRLRDRVKAFVDAVENPGSNQRLLLLSALIRRLGYSPSTEESRERLADYVLENVNRYVAERTRYQNAVDLLAARGTAPALTAIAELYKDRGLSVDTDFRPNFAIETALAEVKRRRMLSSVRRVAIVGPGLDFTDKDAGYDYYPLQTIQPFAVMDSLIRLGLSTPRNLHLSVLEISTPTIDHITQAVARAKAQQTYILQLVLDRSRPWTRGATDYWERLGATIGASVDPLPAPLQVQDVRRRAIRIRSDVIRLIEPLAANVVLQRVVLPQAQRYDLVIGTNILVYYDAFEQALALSNIESMLSPAGIFLTNDVAQDFPGVRLKPAAIVRVPYSREQEDQVQIYTSSIFQPQLPPV